MLTFQNGTFLKDNEDVSHRLIEFLFEDVVLAGPLLLKDLFSWFDLNPLLHHVYRQCFSQQWCAEASKGPSKQAIEAQLRRAGPHPEDLDYLELSESIEFHRRQKIFSGSGFLQMTGKGFPLPSSSPECQNQGYAPGDVISYGLSVTPVRDLLLLEIRLDPLIHIQEADSSSRQYLQIVDTYTRSHVTLGRLIEGVLYELSFHGGPDDQMTYKEELDFLSSQIKENPPHSLTPSISSESMDSDAFLSSANPPSQHLGTLIDDIPLFYKLSSLEFDRIASFPYPQSNSSSIPGSSVSDSIPGSPLSDSKGTASSVLEVSPNSMNALDTTSSTSCASLDPRQDRPLESNVIDLFSTARPKHSNPSFNPQPHGTPKAQVDLAEEEHDLVSWVKNQWIYALRALDDDQLCGPELYLALTQSISQSFRQRMSQAPTTSIPSFLLDSDLMQNLFLSMTQGSFHPHVLSKMPCHAITLRSMAKNDESS